jgi:F-type H+-transporting ATPase subunit delta
LEFIKEEVCVIFLLNRSSFFFKILKFTLNLLGEDAKIERVKILTAFKMTKKEISKILSNMQKHNKKKYTYVQIIDKKLIGGFIVKTKDFVYNNSIKYKLDLIRQGKINIDEK